jgi:hypothetical protein
MKWKMVTLTLANDEWCGTSLWRFCSSKRFHSTSIMCIRLQHCSTLNVVNLTKNCTYTPVRSNRSISISFYEVLKATGSCLKRVFLFLWSFKMCTNVKLFRLQGLKKGKRTFQSKKTERKRTSSTMGEGFDTGLCDCFSDCNLCICAFCCTSCQFGTVVLRFL